MRALLVISVALLPFGAEHSNATAADEATQASTEYVPTLREIMTRIELDRSKLWYSVKLRNWMLARYQLGQVRAGFSDATRFHLLPASEVASTHKVAALVESSIKAKDYKLFEESFAEMTAECNNCHKAVGKSFLHVGAPKVPSPLQ
ncbi:hypothetical protein [Sinorhizobium prairiense]|uniref:hypothetical protein n=1 Tax=unclassified Sinorhizobium TaxID=2613772 RepID=UPI0023D88031|nr:MULTISPECIES: hypothetical protein [unclassified Sinorhizobium]WEJ12134.1 hypothetical protein N0Q90_20275 [Sinorhizobium sp. M103]WEJ17393.1 hypothetical protein N0Q91_22945 [Sinorhizobium sp. K101]WEJ40653.1 hypothetical protein N0R80_28960 [Sinorhizobium sp. C101]